MAMIFFSLNNDFWVPEMKFPSVEIKNQKLRVVTSKCNNLTIKHKNRFLIRLFWETRAS